MKTKLKSMQKIIPINFVPVGSRLVFIRKTQSQKSDGHGNVIAFLRALYECSCGAKKEINVNAVKMGKVKSCGCLQKDDIRSRSSTHGLSKHPLFRIWVDLKTRCYNKNADAYPYYGGRGVVVCDEWKNNFKAFYDWAILNGWERGMEIDKDKIPKEKGIPALLYGPEVCCFLTKKENCNSRRSNHPITFNGRTQNMTQWERELGFNKDNIYNRLRRGWSEEKALSTPLRKY